MMRNKSVVGWILLGLVCWALVGGLTQLHRTGCAVPLTRQCNDGLLLFVGNAIVLDWVYHYQQLLGGLFAVAGAAMVIVAANLQITAAREDRARERKEEWRGAITQLGLTLLSAKEALDGDEYEPGWTTMAEFAAVRPIIAKQSLGLVVRFQNVAREIDRAIRSAEVQEAGIRDINAETNFVSGDVTTTISKGQAYLTLWLKYLPNLLDAFDGQRSFTVPRLPRKELVDEATALDLEPDDLDWFLDLFNDQTEH